MLSTEHRFLEGYAREKPWNIKEKAEQKPPWGLGVLQRNNIFMAVYTNKYKNMRILYFWKKISTQMRFILE